MATASLGLSDTRPGSSPSSTHDALEADIRESDAKGITTVAAGKRVPSTPTADSKSAVSGGLDRRRSGRPTSVVRGGSGGDRSRIGKGMGPKLPVKVSPMASSMADMRNGLRLPDEDSVGH
jgi:hypothetical protein